MKLKTFKAFSKGSLELLKINCRALCLPAPLNGRMIVQTISTASQTFYVLLNWPSSMFTSRAQHFGMFISFFL